MSLANALHRFRKWVYTTPLYTAFQILRLNDLASSVYWRLQLAMSPETITRTVAGYSAQFHIQTPPEYNQFADPTIAGELDTLKEILDALQPDDVFYDIGANVGLHACFAGDIVTDGTVVALEPNPTSATRLRENLALNDVEAIVREYGLDSEHGTATMTLNRQQPGAVGTVATAETDPANTFEIELVPGDSLVVPDGLPAPTVLKVDVDGAELRALRGLETALRGGQCRLVFCEVHPSYLPDFGDTEDELLAFLRDCGFSLSKRTVPRGPDDDVYYLCARKDD